MKICRSCNEKKPLSEFYKHGGMADGHLNYCKVCKTSQSIAYSKTERGRETEKRRNQKPKRQQHLAANTKKWREANPDGYKAQNAVNNAVRDGRLAKAASCERCGCDGLLHGHHEDYSKPLDVEWICVPCHGRENPNVIN